MLEAGHDTRLVCVTSTFIVGSFSLNNDVFCKDDNVVVHLDESIGHLPLLKRCLERSLVIVLRRKEPKECKWDATKVREKLGHLLA